MRAATYPTPNISISASLARWHHGRGIVLRGRNVVHGRYQTRLLRPEAEVALRSGAGAFMFALCGERDVSDSNDMCSGEGVLLTVKTQEIGGDKQLETELGGNVHVRDVFLVAVLVPVMEVLDDLFHDLTTGDPVSLAPKAADAEGRQ